MGSCALRSDLKTRSFDTITGVRQEYFSHLEWERNLPIGNHECVVLKYRSAILAASSADTSPNPEQTSRQSKSQGRAASTPRIATESKKHVARSDGPLDEVGGTKGFGRASDRNKNELGVPDRVWTLALLEPGSDLVGVTGPME
jgi:hypothetical protein